MIPVLTRTVGQGLLLAKMTRDTPCKRLDTEKKAVADDDWSSGSCEPGLRRRSKRPIDAELQRQVADANGPVVIDQDLLKEA